MSGIALVIPAYNEEKAIIGTLQSYYSMLQKNFDDFEIIVVANCCTDGTEKLVKEFSKNKKIKLFSSQIKGKGAAVRKGFELANLGLIGFTDADSSTSPQQFLKIANEVKAPFDGAIASRGMKGSVMNIKQPLHRTIMGQIFNRMTNAMFGLGYKDAQCGAKVFTKKSIKTVLPGLTVNGFAFDVELLWEMKKNGFKIKEVPIVWNDSEKSSVSFLTAPKMFLTILRLRIFGKA